MYQKKPIAIDMSKPEDKRPLESWELGETRRSDTMHAWEQCPVCGEHHVDIVSDNLSDEMYDAIYIGKCSSCEWIGEIYFSVKYSDTVTDPDGLIQLI